MKLAEARTQTTNGHGHMLLLVSVHTDDHLTYATALSINNCRHLYYLPESSPPAERADNTAMGLRARLL